MRISISHVSEYSYDGPAAASLQALRLHPAPAKGQTILSWTVEAPGIDTAATYIDGFGNRVDLVAGSGEAKTIRVVAQGEVETEDNGGVAGWTGESLAPGAYLRVNAVTKASPAIETMADKVRDPDTLATLHDLMAAIHKHMTYRPDSTDAHTTAAEAFAAGKGVCQDYAHIFIAAARYLEIPTRYVTGYLLLEDGSGAAAHHAWAEALVEHIGWVGFDATNDMCPTERYVRLGSALDAATAAPIRGVRRLVGEEKLTVSVSVQEIAQSQTQTQQ